VPSSRRANGRDNGTNTILHRVAVVQIEVSTQIRSHVQYPTFQARIYFCTDLPSALGLKWGTGTMDQVYLDVKHCGVNGKISLKIAYQETQMWSFISVSR
jgi:hypothetical protein